MRILSEQIDGIWYALALNEHQQLVACSFSDRNEREAVKAVESSVRSPSVARRSDGEAHPLFRKLHELYIGKGRTELKSLDLSSVSAFRRKVYKILREIPRGRVTTYGAIAKKLGSSRYARAVGTAVASNPLPLIVPCHRVVPSSLEIGNYGMPDRRPSEGAYIKHGLLEREGAKVLANKVSKQSLWYPR